MEIHNINGLHRSAICVALALACPGAQVWANPTGGVVVQGSATMVSNGSQLLVHTQNAAGTQQSAINWQSFSIPAGSTTYFQQPSATSTVINRVVTATPSLIYGTLGSNGQVVLVNQSGITLGAGALVDTAGFTASALRMTDADALSGRMRFGDGSQADGALSVAGSILARSGDVVLIGARVDTSREALVQAPNGSTLLAAGQQVEITGRGLEGIRLQVQAPTDAAVNLGTLQGDAVGMFASTLRHSGVAQAHAVTVDGGRVYLKASDLLQVDGQVQARALAGRGGSIQATAGQVAVGATAVLDANGVAGGGEVLVGGGYQGRDARLANARTTQVAAGALLSADATDRGDGGTVVVWADGSTFYAGALSARGGDQGGNGGRAEVSGKQYLAFQGTADLRAPSGQRGQLLLDPVTLNIVADGYGTSVTSPNPYVDPNYGGSVSALTASSIGNLLASADVTLAASGDIGLQESISKVADTSVPTGATTLKLVAGGNFTSSGNYSISGTDSTRPLNVVIEAQGAINGGSVQWDLYGGNLQATAKTGALALGSVRAQRLALDAAGTVSLASSGNYVNSLKVSSGGNSGFTFYNHNIEIPGDMTLEALSVGGGNVLIDNYGGISTTGAVAATGGTLSITAHSPVIVSSNLSASGSISLSASTDITLHAGYSIRSSGGSVSLTATNNIQQYGYVYGATGVTASATNGTISFGLTGYSGGSPLNYSQSGGSVFVPQVPLIVTTTSALGDPLASPIDDTLAAGDSTLLAGNDPFDPKNRDAEGLTVEGELCVP